MKISEIMEKFDKIKTIFGDINVVLGSELWEIESVSVKQNKNETVCILSEEE
jgi:hypothetical protein